MLVAHNVQKGEWACQVPFFPPHQTAEVTVLLVSLFLIIVPVYCVLVLYVLVLVPEFFGIHLVAVVVATVITFSLVTPTLPQTSQLIDFSPFGPCVSTMPLSSVAILLGLCYTLFFLFCF